MSNFIRFFAIVSVCLFAGSTSAGEAKRGCIKLLDPMPQSANFFERLGLPRDGKGVTLADIKAGRNHAAKLFHPDQGGSDTEMRNILEAYNKFETEGDVCNYRDNLPCDPSTFTELQSYYADTGANKNLRERQKIATAILADLKASKLRVRNVYDALDGSSRLIYMSGTPSPAVIFEMKSALERKLAGLRSGNKKAALDLKIEILNTFFSSEMNQAARRELIQTLLADVNGSRLAFPLVEWYALRSANPAAFVRKCMEILRELFQNLPVNAEFLARRQALTFFMTQLPATLGQQEASEIAEKESIILFDESVVKLAKYRRGDVTSDNDAFKELEEFILKDRISSAGGSEKLFQSLRSKELSTQDISTFLLLLGNWPNEYEAAKEASYATEKFEIIIHLLFGENAEPVRKVASKAVDILTSKLSYDVHHNRLFEYDAVLNLAEKYPVFERWGHEQLDKIK